LKTLQETGLCHRNLSLDSALLNGDQLDICDLGWAMRYNPKAPVDEDRPFPPPGGSNPQFIPPEYFRGTTTGSWDGFRGDLWSAGLILYSMVVGREGMFTAPIAEDKSFARLCIKGDVRGQLKRYGKLVGRDFSGFSDELIDLLRKMMRADPQSRLSLEEVLEHPWLTNDEVISPTAWIAAHKPSSSTTDA
jgi:serine/threonine protein kinase